MKTIHLVACCGKKLENLAPAKELYQSQLFRKARAVVEATGETWFVLSALHQLVHPDKVLHPYNHSLRTDMDRHDRQRWAGMVFGQLETHLVNPPAKVVFWAGRTYCEPLATLLAARGYAVKFPLMGLGIGQQLKHLTELLHVEKTLRLRSFEELPNGAKRWKSESYAVTLEPEQRRLTKSSGFYLSRREGRDLAGSLELHGRDTLCEIAKLLEVASAHS